MLSKFSLTAHGIDANWQRHKFILCVRHFPGEHNFETIGDVVGRMLEDWGIEKKKQHVFLRDEGGNMKKVGFYFVGFTLLLFRHSKKADTCMRTAALTN